MCQREFLVAHLADELLISMDQSVVVLNIRLRVAFVAQLAIHHFQRRVHPLLVQFDVINVLPALIALGRLGLYVIIDHMLSQIALRFQALATDLAHDRLLRIVHLGRVILQMGKNCEF